MTNPVLPPDIPVVFDHPEFLIVNKPPGIPVQNEPELSGILPRVQQQQGLQNLWLVHRLDKVTSGLLLLAKNQQAASQLSGLFASRQIEKYYLAITDKKPNRKQGTIAGDMHKVRDGKWILKRSHDNPAVSQFFSAGMGDGKRLFVIRPLTGKTHQIRVALKSLGSPILGDTTYTGNEADRTYLHAWQLIFEFQGQAYTISAVPQQGCYFTNDNFQQTVSQFMPVQQLAWPKVKGVPQTGGDTAC